MAVDRRSTVLFPLNGFALEGEKIETVRGVEIWSHEYVRSLKPRGLKGRQERQYFVDQRLQDSDAEAKHAYLAVPQARVAFNEVRVPGHSGTKFLTGWDPHSIRERALPLADEVSGLLAIAFLTWRSALSPALEHHELVRDGWYRVALSDRLLLQRGGRVRTVINEPVVLSQELHDSWMSHPALLALVQIVVDSCSGGLAKQIRAAVKRYPYALHSHDLSVQVVLAHSLLEGLLGSHKRAVLTSRVGALCGAQAESDFEVLTEARNEFVHQGVEVREMYPCNLGHRLVASVLARAADLVDPGGSDARLSKGEFRDYLDGLAHSLEASRKLGQDLGQDLVRHQQSLVPWSAASVAGAQDVFDPARDWRLVSSAPDGFGGALVTFRRGDRFVSVPAALDAVIRAETRWRGGPAAGAARALSAAIGTEVLPVRDEHDMEVFLVVRERAETSEASGI